MVNLINEIATPNFKRAELEIDSKSTRLQPPTATKQVTAEASWVNLSSTSKQISTLKDMIMAEPEVNQDRIEHFKNEIDSRRYKIHANEIAERMLKDMQHSTARPITEFK